LVIFLVLQVDELRDVWERVTGEVGLAQVGLLVDFACNRDFV